MEADPVGADDGFLPSHNCLSPLLGDSVGCVLDILPGGTDEFSRPILSHLGHTPGTVLGNLLGVQYKRLIQRPDLVCIAPGALAARAGKALLILHIGLEIGWITDLQGSTVHCRPASA